MHIFILTVDPPIREESPAREAASSSSAPVVIYAQPPRVLCAAFSLSYV